MSWNILSSAQCPKVWFDGKGCYRLRSILIKQLKKLSYGHWLIFILNKWSDTWSVIYAFFPCKNKLTLVFRASVLILKLNFFEILSNFVCRRNSWLITGVTHEKLIISICKLGLYLLHKKFLKLIIMKYRKILPGSKSCDSQQEVKRCFGIRWYVFRWLDLLEVCRIQTSSAGKEQKYLKWKVPQRSTA